MTGGGVREGQARGLSCGVEGVPIWQSGGRSFCAGGLSHCGGGLACRSGSGRGGDHREHGEQQPVAPGRDRLDDLGVARVVLEDVTQLRHAAGQP